MANIGLANQPMPDSGTLSNLYVRVTNAPGAGASYIFTVYKNSVATGLTVTIADAATVATPDTSNTVSYSAGDVICLETVPSAGTAPAAAGLLAWAVDNDSSGQALLAGSTTTNGNAADSWLALQGSVRATAITSMETIVPTDGVIDNLYFHVSGTLGTDNTYTATLIKNGSDTALTATVTASEIIMSNTADDVSVAAGDLVFWRITPASTPTARACHPSVRFTPTIDGESIQTYASSSNASSASNEVFIGIGGGAMVTQATDSNRLAYQYGVYDAKKLHAAVDTAPDTGAGTQTWTIKIRSNGTSSSVSTTISESATTATPDTSNTVTSTTLGNLGFSWQGSGTPTLSPSRASFVTYRAPAVAGDTPQRMLTGVGT